MRFPLSPFILTLTFVHDFFFYEEDFVFHILHVDILQLFVFLPDTPDAKGILFINLAPFARFVGWMIWFSHVALYYSKIKPVVLSPYILSDTSYAENI